MTDFDDKVARALSAPEEDLSIAELERPLFAQVGDTFRGRWRWLTLMVWGSGLVMTALFMVCAVRFFQVSEPGLKLTYALCVLFLGHAVALQKTWYWMLLNRNVVLRELKRLELQVARLSERDGES